VLVVDDDDALREALVDLIETEGYTASGVANGREALNYLEVGAARPKLILLDLMMPIMDGWEVLKELRRVDALATITVVIISARYSDLADVTDPSLPVRRMPKPIDTQALMRVLKETCGSAR